MFLSQRREANRYLGHLSFWKAKVCSSRSQSICSPAYIRATDWSTGTSAPAMVLQRGLASEYFDANGEASSPTFTSFCMHNVRDRPSGIRCPVRPPDAARADYAIVLEPTPRLQAALPFLEPLPGAVDPSWAPTLTADVIHCPFASVIETKKDGGEPQKAEYQLGIWAYTIFKRLRLLLEANGQAQQPLPCLPLFMVEGERWDFYIAFQGADARTVR